MNYKYYIYKQAVLGSYFNKYSLTNYSLIREIQNNGKWTLKTSRDTEFFTVIRTKLSGDITVKGDDYYALIALEETHLQYAIVIEVECGGIWTERWKGYFSYFDFKVDRDKCYLTFEPEVWDEYSPVYDQMPIDRNALLGDVDWTMIMTTYVFPWEKVTQNYVSFTVTLASWHEYSPGTKYYLYSIDTQLDYWDVDGGYPVYGEVNEYRRDYGLTTSNAVDPSGGGGGGFADWTYLEEVSPGVHKWIRPYLNSAYVAPYSYVVSGDNVFQELQTGTGPVTYLFGLKRLNKILEYYASICNLTYTSDFFTASPCPMGGTSLEWTMLQQINNLIKGAAGEQSTKGIIKLKDLLTWIRDTFNVYWYIDANGDFRLEHRRYFDSGLSYPYAAAITQDLNALYPVNLTKMNRYEWGKPELFRFERLEFPYSTFSDWVNAKIEYPQLSILNNETKTLIVEWGTDIISMYDNRGDLPKQGWVLLNCNLVGNFYQVINTVGAITGQPQQNARFSSANLMRDLWTWGRTLPTGNVNGVSTTFNSIQRLRKQVEVNIQQCCQDLDYNGLFRTELGDGILSEAEYEMNGNLKMNLIYE